MKRSALKTLFLATAAILVLSSYSPAQEPIKIGVVYSLSGTYAALGSSTANAVKLAFGENHFTISGRKVELIVEDDEGKPDVGIAKLRKLVERDKVNLLHAITFTNIGFAARDYVHGSGVPWITLTASGALTRDKASPTIFRVAPSNYQMGLAPAKWLHDKLGWKKIVWVGANYSAPREIFEAFKKVYESNIVEAVWPPLGTPDFAPFLAKLTDVQADGTVVAAWGGDALKFLPQYNDYGLRAKLPLFGLASFTSEEILPGMPPAIEGVISAYVYCGSLDNPLNKKFIEGYKAQFAGLPGSYQYMGYIGAKIAAQAINEIGGRVEDRDALVKAIAKTRDPGSHGGGSLR